MPEKTAQKEPDKKLAPSKKAEAAAGSSHSDSALRAASVPGSSLSGAGGE